MAEDARIAALTAENARLRRRLIEGGLEPDAGPAEADRPVSPEVVAILHRSRNVLAMVRAIVRRSADGARSAEDCIARLDGRLGVIGRIQTAGILHPSGGIDLSAILADELLAQLAREGDRVSLSGPRVLLASRAAEIVALAIHELASNAVEHGALTRRDGRISVDWCLEPGGAAPLLTLVWSETGMAGLAPVPPRRGFGTEMLEQTLRYELRAQTALVYRPEGLRYTVSVPLIPRIGTVPPGDYPD